MDINAAFIAVNRIMITLKRALFALYGNRKLGNLFVRPDNNGDDWLATLKNEKCCQGY